jgi:hypothetical protein
LFAKPCPRQEIDRLVAGEAVDTVPPAQRRTLGQA